MKNSMPITSNARTLLKSAGPRIGLHVGQYLIASVASALTSISKATMRKNGNCSRLFCGNDASAYRAAIVYSLIGTCKNAGIEPRAWMEDVLKQIPYNLRDGRDLLELLPRAWHPRTNFDKVAAISDKIETNLN